MTPYRIRTLRKKLKLSSKEFGERIGLIGEHARITVWRWETGRRKPSPQTIILMKQLSQTDSDYRKRLQRQY